MCGLEQEDLDRSAVQRERTHRDQNPTHPRAQKKPRDPIGSDPSRLGVSPGEDEPDSGRGPVRLSQLMIYVSMCCSVRNETQSAYSRCKNGGG